MEIGISSSQIDSIGKGGEDLLFPKPETQAESDANRRIEITFHSSEN